MPTLPSRPPCGVRNVGRHAPTRLARALGLAFGAFVLCVPLAGCAARYIPNTDVEDTDDNREVIKFCETYRRAIEMQNVPALLTMASSKYYEDGGNVDPTDDLDFAGLEDWLGGRFKDTKAIRYEIRYRRVTKGDRNRILVLYTYSASYKVPGLKQDEWRHTVSENRLELEPEGRSYKIVAGM